MGNYRIAKNAGLLYIRMAIVMLVTLYTSRVIIQTIGIVDYGLYGVIHGLVASFAFLSSSLSNSIQRFLNHAIGEGRSVKYINKVFSQAFWIVIILALFIFLLCETLGLWFVTEKLEIPFDRYKACISLFHCSIIVLLLQTIQIPFISAIMAREKFSFYAWTSILDALLKLLIVYVLKFYNNCDSLELYGYLLIFITTSLCVSYILYCIIAIKECRISMYWNNVMLRSFSSFIGFNFFGSTLNLFTIHGLNIICNLFIGAVANAAITIMFQIKTAVYRLTEGVFDAIKPRLIQNYAKGNVEYMNILVDNGSKYVYILILTFSLALFFETNYILTLWLVEVPLGTIIITKLILIDVLIMVLVRPLSLIAIARANIKNIEVYGRMITAFSLVVIYIYLYLGGKNVCNVVLFYVLSTLVYYFYCMKDCLSQIHRPINSYLKKVLFPILKITLFSVLINYGIYRLMDEGLLRFFIFIICGFITNIIGLYICASSSEKENIRAYLDKIYNSIFNDEK